jgi:predicted HTH domain antitoxin
MILTQELKLELPFEISSDEIKLLLAIKFYELEKLSIGQAAKVAGYSKRALWRFWVIIKCRYLPILPMI